MRDFNLRDSDKYTIFVCSIKIYFFSIDSFRRPSITFDIEIITFICLILLTGIF